MNTFTHCMAVLGLTTGMAGLAPAAPTPINILNPGFEAQLVFGEGGFSNANQTNDWISPFGSGFGNITEAMIPGQGTAIGQPGNPPGYNNMGYLNPTGNLAQNLVYSNLSPVLVAPNQKYSISLDFGLRSDSNPNSESPVEIRIIETSGLTVIASTIYDLNQGQGLGTIVNQSFDLNVGASPAGIGSQARIEFFLLDDFVLPSSNQALIDNIVAGVEVVPEPSSLALIAGGLFAARRRSMKR